MVEEPSQCWIDGWISKSTWREMKIAWPTPRGAKNVRGAARSRSCNFDSNKCVAMQVTSDIPWSYQILGYKFRWPGEHMRRQSDLMYGMTTV